MEPDRAEVLSTEKLLNGSYLPVSFRQKTRQIATDVVNFVCRGEDADQPPSRACALMRDLVTDTLRERAEFMQRLAASLPIKEKEDLELIDKIATGVFDDDHVNWGRIVTMHAFCAYLARYCEDGAFPDCADDISRILADLMTNRLGLWIVTNGGWAAFEAQFPQLLGFSSGGLWKGLVLLLLVLGSAVVFYGTARYMNDGQSPFPI